MHHKKENSGSLKATLFAAYVVGCAAPGIAAGLSAAAHNAPSAAPIPVVSGILNGVGHELFFPLARYLGSAKAGIGVFQREVQSVVPQNFSDLPYDKQVSLTRTAREQTVEASEIAQGIVANLDARLNSPKEDVRFEAIRQLAQVGLVLGDVLATSELEQLDAEVARRSLELSGPYKADLQGSLRSLKVRMKMHHIADELIGEGGAVAAEDSAVRGSQSAGPARLRPARPKASFEKDKVLVVPATKAVPPIEEKFYQRWARLWTGYGKSDYDEAAEFRDRHKSQLALLGDPRQETALVLKGQLAFVHLDGELGTVELRDERGARQLLRVEDAVAKYKVVKKTKNADGESTFEITLKDGRRVRWSSPNLIYLGHTSLGSELVLNPSAREEAGLVRWSTDATAPLREHQYQLMRFRGAPERKPQTVSEPPGAWNYGGR